MKKCKVIFEGWEVDGVLYPPDKPPQHFLDQIQKVLEELIRENRLKNKVIGEHTNNQSKE